MTKFEISFLDQYDKINNIILELDLIQYLKNGLYIYKNNTILKLFNLSKREYYLKGYILNNFQNSNLLDGKIVELLGKKFILDKKNLCKVILLKDLNLEEVSSLNNILILERKNIESRLNSLSKSEYNLAINRIKKINQKIIK